jgi:hypothetical protein
VKPKPPIIKGRPLTDEEKRLIAILDEMERKGIEYLDQSAKRIIELVTALLGVAVAIIAFGENFPPPYLKDNLFTRTVSSLSLICYLAALLLALWAVHPQNYKKYRHNLNGMNKELQQIMARKRLWVTVSGILFGLGSVLLTVLIGVIIWEA